MKALPTLRQLQFFVALARRESFSRAAEDCLVSQSTLSSAIKELETVLDATLVDRTSRSFSLTPVGEMLLRQAEELIALAEDMVRSASRPEPLTGVMKLGVIPTIGPFILPEAMPLFEKGYPDLSLYLREDLTASLVERLRAGMIDVALIAFPYEAEGLDTMDIAEDPFWFVCAPSHRLAGRKRIGVSDLTGEDLLLLEDGHCLRDHALSACQLQMRETANTFGATSLFTLTQMTRSGLGATLLPEMAIRQGLAKASNLVAIPFAGKADEVPARQIGLAWRRGSGFEQEAEAIAGVLKAALKKPVHGDVAAA